MNGTRDHRLRRAGPLEVLIECPGPTCDGHVKLRTIGGSGSKAVGRCPTCGERAVLHAGVLEPVRHRRAGDGREDGA